MLWHSFDIIAALLQENASILLSPLPLNMFRLFGTMIGTMFGTQQNEDHPKSYLRVSSAKRGTWVFLLDAY